MSKQGGAPSRMDVKAPSTKSLESQIPGGRIGSLETMVCNYLSNTHVIKDREEGQRSAPEAKLRAVENKLDSFLGSRLRHPWFLSDVDHRFRVLERFATGFKDPDRSLFVQST